MKNYLIIFIFFYIVGCATNKNVYWCGDHPCIDKKEKEAYFKKTMIVEIKNISKKDKKDNSEISKLMQQAKKDEKKRIKTEKDLAKQAKIEEKRRIKMEKETAKQAKIEEKRRIKMEKELEKQVKKDRKKRIKEEEELIREVKLEEKKQIKSKKKDTKKKVSKNYEKSPKKEVELDVNLGKIKVDINKFGEIVEKIIERNSLRPYPDINNIPN